MLQFLNLYYLPLKEGIAVHFIKPKFPFPEDAFVDIGQVVLEKKLEMQNNYRQTGRIKSKYVIEKNPVILFLDSYNDLR